MKVAMFYNNLSDTRVQCNLCSHRCTISDRKRGICGVRENRDGALYSLVYGRTVARYVDPIEKKPLFHFYPGSTAFSIGTPGCNFRCQWCQNWEISQMSREQHPIMGDEIIPEQIVSDAKQTGCKSIAYTYTEPTIFFEYAYDTSLLAHENGFANVFITNGYMTKEMLEVYHPYLDAVNVDLKAFRDETYQKYVCARLQPVLDSLRLIKKYGIWVEVTTLIIPGINDDNAELQDAAHFIADELGKETPWHISRFFPSYKMTDVPPTPFSTLQKAREIGLEAGLHYVYKGNISGEENTLCHNCGYLLVRRSGYSILENNIGRNRRCPSCGTLVAGVGMNTNNT
ncbi:AmmeMemoRadiSam system radical SAM enzyme [bacterium]|nr:AmmeMemoRadiSam system radical SAM enzyme [candidate division CSSED10-310 bacterium]